MLQPGAIFKDGKSTFTLYAPHAKKARVVFPDSQRKEKMMRQDGGYWTVELNDLKPGDKYLLQTDIMQDARPDPASLYQPTGVHGPSELIDSTLFNAPAHQPGESWAGRELKDMIIYELHIGSFSEAGTFEGAIEHLLDLSKLGVNTIELMPVNAFPGDHNWGYDGVYWQAVQASYGGPQGLKNFIDAAHDLGLAVIIDAVFNHLGPEGNYLPQFAPYFTDKYNTPWGPAINLDDHGSDGVRDFILACAKTWLVDYGADGLRLDAVHALRDSSATHILAELSACTKVWAREQRRPLTLIGECDLNDPRYISPTRDNGLGLSGQWVDEFHHALRTYMTGETRGYYSDFGPKEALLQTLRRGYVYNGQYSHHRGRKFGGDPSTLNNYQFVVFGQNHDQVGNRAIGDRLHHHLSEDEYLLQAATVIWSPFTPMLWMGEEYMEEAPFPYFVDHGDQGILEATRKGRIREFTPFLGDADHVPDPGEHATFISAKLSHQRHGRVYDFYREALAIRRRYWHLRQPEMSAHKVEELSPEVIGWQFQLSTNQQLTVIANFSKEAFWLSDLLPSWAVASDELRCATSKISDSLHATAAAVWLRDKQ